MKHFTMLNEGETCCRTTTSTVSNLMKALLLSFMFVLWGPGVATAQSLLKGGSAPIGQTNDDGDQDSNDEGDVTGEGCNGHRIGYGSFETSSTTSIFPVGFTFHQGWTGSDTPCNRQKSLWFGGYYGSTPQESSAERTILVPSQASTLSFAYLTLFGENTTGDEYAHISVNGTNVVNISMSDDNITDGWVESTVDLSAYAGQMVTLRFYNDAPVGGNIGNVFFSCLEWGCPPCTPSLEMACAPAITVTCSDIDNLEVTGIPTITGEFCGAEMNLIHSDNVLSSSACGSIIARTWVVTVGNMTESCTQIITVVDNQGPQISGVTPVIEVQCREEVPAPANASAFDACSGDAQVSTFTSNTGDILSRCILTSAYGPGADWAFWAPELAEGGISSSANFHFVSNGTFDTYVDGTAHLYGTVANDVNPSQQFALSLWFENKADWNAWSSMGRGYKDDMGCAQPNLYTLWNYYELVNGFSTATGLNALAGVNLQLEHAPNNYYFGFQVGQGANNKNCNYGFSGWFTYHGMNGNSPISGHGDLNCDANCEPFNNEGCFQNTSYTYLYMANDACGHATIASQSIIVNDTTAPTFVDCPESLTIQCSDAIPAIATPSATDNCIGEVAVQFLGEVEEGNSCTRTLTRTWAASDLCNNRAFCTQVITIIDTVAPQFSSIPVETINASCDAVPAADVLTATDNCDNGSEVGFYEETIPGNCPGNYTLIRTWSTSDICGNSNSVSQTVNVTDTTGPVFANYQYYTQVNCEDIAEYTLTASDACGSATVEITFEQLNSGGCLGVLHRVYTATDLCGNVTTATQFITIVDHTAPSIIGVGEEMTIQCSEVEGFDGYLFGAGNVYGEDNCGGEVSVSYSEEVVETDDNCPNSYDVIRQWIAIDYCENADTATQMIHVVDTTNPWFEFVPENFEQSCEVAYPSIVNAIAYDNCDDNVSVEVTDNIIDGDDCEAAYVIERVYRAYDNCGNSEIATQYITIYDRTAPMFDENSVSQLSFECGDEIVGVQPTATDNCSEFTITVQDTMYSNEPCYKTGAFIYTAVDACGNTNSFYQYFTIVDTTAPMFADYDHEIEMPCDNYSGIFVEASDVCNEVEITYEDEFFSGGFCAGIITRTYTATDVCGNEETTQQIIRLIDEVDPTVEGVTPNFETQCGSDYVVSTPEFSDNCDDNLDITDDVQESFDGCTTTVTYTWTAIDHCGNTTVATTVVTIVDTIDPYFTSGPESFTMSCEAAYPAVAVATASDLCDTQVEVSSSDSIVAGSCPSNYTIVRTYVAVDNCGNDASYIQYITVVDNNAPEFDYEISVSELTFECGDEIVGVDPIVSDNCSEFTVSMQDTMYVNEPCEKSGAFIYTAVDACGNSSTFYQYFTIVDTTAPMFADYDQEIEMPCDNYSGIFVEASDVCNEVEITYEDDFFSGGFCAGIVNRTYTATDACGNFATAQQIIRLIDEVDPTVEGVTPSFEVQCGNEYVVSTPMFSDNCDNNLNITSDIVEGGTACARTMTYTWTAVDHCGNTTVATTVVTIVDTLDPYFTSIPEGYTAEYCDVLEYGNAYANDLCDGLVDVTVSVDTIAGDCAHNYTIVRTFTAVDACGNDAVATQEIIVEDTTDPTFTFVPQGGLVYCGDYNGYELATATDLCGTAEVTPSVSEENVTMEVEGGLLCVNRITVEWTATDLCGNTSTAVTVINVYDNVAPTFVGEVSDVTVSCASEIPALVELTATDYCSNATVTRYVTDLEEADVCGNQQFRVNYVATDECGNQAFTSYVVTVDDNIDPVFSSLPSDLTIACDAEVPAAIELTATDNCGGEVEVTMIETTIGEQPEPGSIADCNVLTPALGSNNCDYDYDWAMILFGVPDAHKYFAVQSGELITYPNNTLHLVVDVVNVHNSADGFHVDVEFVDGMNWAAWSTQSFATNFKSGCESIVDQANHVDWMYYILNNNNSSMTGFGAYAGSSINFTHAPSSKYFGFQLGDGANNLTASDNGFGGWFNFSGSFIYNGAPLTNGNFQGTGDFAFDLDCCPDYYISRCYTAVDCSGNIAQHCQNIYFGEEIVNVDPQTPGNEEVTEEPLAALSVYPNPTAGQATFNLKSVETGKASIEIFDLAGAKVATVINTAVEAGTEYNFGFDASRLATGVYIYRMNTGGNVEMGRLVISK